MGLTVVTAPSPSAATSCGTCHPAACAATGSGAVLWTAARLFAAKSGVRLRGGTAASRGWAMPAGNVHALGCVIDAATNVTAAGRGGRLVATRAAVLAHPQSSQHPGMAASTSGVACNMGAPGTCGPCGTRELVLESPLSAGSLMSLSWLPVRARSS